MTNTSTDPAGTDGSLQEPNALRTMRSAISLLIGIFILWTAVSGPFDSLVQRSVMLALVITLGSVSYTHLTLPTTPYV